MELGNLDIETTVTFKISDVENKKYVYVGSVNDIPLYISPDDIQVDVNLKTSKGE